MVALEPTCTVHIGAPKTGSTALQKYLTDHRKTLLDAGILYFGSGLRGFGHHDLAFLLYGNYPNWAKTQHKTLEQFRKEYHRETAGHPGHLLLSSENFYLYPKPELLRKFLDQCSMTQGRQTRIIVYVRRQDEAHESWYNQTIKAQGYSHGFRECVKAFYSLWDYQTNLKSWADTFGRDRLTVIPYISTNAKPFDVVENILRLFGLDPADYPKQTERLNTEINRDILEFQRLLNQLSGTPEEKRCYHKAFIAMTQTFKGSGVFDESPCIPLAVRRELLKKYSEGNKLVAQTYLGRDELFPDILPDTNQPEQAYTGLSVKQFIRIINMLNGKLFVDNTTLKT